MGALDAIVRAGKALYVGHLSYSAQRTGEGGGDPEGARHAAADHQPSYNMLNRWVERDG
jgi:L-glyceraldehyde 3-phosphate reductase